MKGESKAKWFSELSFEDAYTAFHLAYAFAPAAASLAALYFRKDLHLELEAILVGSVVIINALILWSRSQSAKQTKELSPLYTFIWNKLLPNRSGSEQKYKVSVRVIEDQKAAAPKHDEQGASKGDAKGDFCSALERRFKTSFGVEKLTALLSEEHRLKSPILKERRLEDLRTTVDDLKVTFDPIDLGPYRKPSGQAEEQQLLRECKEHLGTELKRPTAVILVRTDESDERPWLYQGLSDWGNKHSEIPILFVTNPDKTYKADVNANKFLWMPHDPRSLPWRLLERALTRSQAWRFQATFNRAMFWNGVYILLLVINLALIHVTTLGNRLEKQKELNRTANAAMDAALFTERKLRGDMRASADSSFAVSYWYRIDGVPYMLVTTELDPAYEILANDYTTIIGCVFKEPNRLVESKLISNSEFKTEAYSRYGKTEMPNCTMGKFDKKFIKHIACVSRNADSATIGICAFTLNANNDFLSETDSLDERVSVGEKTRESLWTAVDDFHKQFLRQIENNRYVSRFERVTR